MKKILLVEDAAFFEKAALRKLSHIGETNISVARCYADAERLIREQPDDLPSLALVDLTLPDARNGEIVDLCREHDIPTVVFTGRYEAPIRKAMLDKGILDYVIKDSPTSLDYIGDLVQRLWRNPSIGILVVDDVKHERNRLSSILSKHRYQIFEADNSAEGIELLKNYPQIKLAIVDYFMPNEDGFSFLKNVRRRFSREKVAVLGMSGYEASENRIRFLKYGASDFLHKSCTSEEILLRVSQNLDIIDRFSDLYERSVRDALTGLYNRGFLFNECAGIVKRSSPANSDFWLAMVDLDSFKTINDTYGHPAGDAVLQAVAAELDRITGQSEHAIRLGGDEFCLFLKAESEQHAVERLESICNSLRTKTISAGDRPIPFSVSIGITPILDGDLDSALGRSDARMYEAKVQAGDFLIAAG